VLQAYLDQMSDLLISNKDRPSLYDEHPPDSLKSVARARTLTVLPRLDGERKARVVQFLYESGLIVKGRLVVDLRGADLTEVNLSEANLYEVNLRGADLSPASLARADLSSANLIGANLRGVRGWTAEQLRAASSLEGATMPYGRKYEDRLKDKEGRKGGGENR
jgi:Pentapeptide repeats (8 copies)